MQSNPPPHVVVVVDQSDRNDEDSLADFQGSTGLVRIVDDGVGLSRARNLGMAAAEAAGASAVAFMDDDCEADNAWLAGFAASFAAAEDVALVFGTTRAAPYDRSRGLIPAYEVRRPGIHRGLAAKTDVEGIGACMALRLDAWRRVAGFDEHLGAGTRLASAEETDLVVRLLLARFAVAETPDALVVHHGFRDWQAARPLIGGYMRGVGAAMAKMTRLAGIAAWQPLARLALRWLGGRPVVDLNHLPSRSFRLAAFLEGARAGWRTAIDRPSGRFLPAAGLPPRAGAERLPLSWPREPAAASGRCSGGVVRPPRWTAWEATRRQMVWLFSRRHTAWMGDSSLRGQLPFAFRLFAAYCMAWTAMTRWSWIPGGKQAFFMAVGLNRLLRGPREVFLRMADAVIGVDAADPRMLKAVGEALPGADGTAVLSQLLTAGDSFVDVGANHGSYCIAASRLVGSSGAIVAVEPLPKLASLLERTLRHTAACRAQVLVVAAGARREQSRFHVLRRNSGESSLFRGASTDGVHSVAEVSVERIDDVVAWRELPGETVLKLDIEGAEYFALDGARTLITNLRPLVLLEVNPEAMAAAGVTGAMLLARLSELGYDRYADAGSAGVASSLHSLDCRVKRDVVAVPTGRPWPRAETRVTRDEP